MIYACSVLWKHGDVLIFVYVIGVEIDRHVCFLARLLASPRSTAQGAGDGAENDPSRPVDPSASRLLESAS